MVKKIYADMREVEDEDSWSDFASSVSWLMKKVAGYKAGQWLAYVKNFGWRSTRGYALIRAENGRELLGNVLPRTDNSPVIWTDASEPDRFFIQNYHHDSPVGNEWYTIIPLDLALKNGEWFREENSSSGGIIPDLLDDVKSEWEFEYCQKASEKGKMPTFDSLVTKFLKDHKVDKKYMDKEDLSELRYVYGFYSKAGASKRTSPEVKHKVLKPKPKTKVIKR